MTAELLPCVEVSPPGPALRSVIWLHGLGADGHDFETVVPYLGLPEGHGVRFVFPHAPRRAVTINMGLIMPAWYDIRGARLQEDEDEVGIRESAERVATLLARENDRGVACRDIVLAGFSQGGALALHVALRHPERLAGVLALSCYLPRAGALVGERSAANAGLPVFLAHGTEDPLVPYDCGLAARDRLAELGYDVEWRDYRMGHGHPREITTSAPGCACGRAMTPEHETRARGYHPPLFGGPIRAASGSRPCRSGRSWRRPTGPAAGCGGRSRCPARPAATSASPSR
jgi:phospholipase/carboxylesterase